MRTFFKKISAIFDNKPNLKDVYNDTYNAKLLKEAYEGIVPGIIAKAGYFAIEWVLYLVSVICMYFAWFIWSGPLDAFLYHLTSNRPPSSAEKITPEMIDLFEYTSLIFLLLPGFILFIVARFSRNKHKQIDKLAIVAKKIDEVEKNLTYRIENKI